ncbi:MAG: lipocalin family protein [Syntrophorhabdus sp.]
MTTRQGFIAGFFAAIVGLFAGCVGIPEGLQPVKNFDITRYLGTWYEIARFEHSFEKGLVNVKAEYSLRDDGGITVVNSGYDPDKKIWKEAKGKGYFVESPDIGRLKVSFFGPFYGAYNILVLDENYRYALVCGPTRNYLWILSRTPTMDEAIKADLIQKAANMGFDMSKIILVKQE